MKEILFLILVTPFLAVSVALAHLQLIQTIFVEPHHWSWGFIGRPHLTSRSSLHGEAVAFPLSRPPAAFYRLAAPDLKRSTLVLLISMMIALVSRLLNYASASHRISRAVSLFVTLLLDSEVTTIIMDSRSPQLQPNLRRRLSNCRRIPHAYR
jgi:hypothetical protein